MNSTINNNPVDSFHNDVVELFARELYLDYVEETSNLNHEGYVDYCKNLYQAMKSDATTEEALARCGLRDVITQHATV